MKSIVKKSSLIICISINLLILINIVQSFSSIKDLRYNDSGQCELNGLIVEPGERLNHPDECLQVVCFRDGSGRGKVNYCPWDPDAEYLDTTLPYPKCCKVKESKSYKQFRTYYRQPSGETSRVNKQLQNKVENSQQESTVNNDFDVEKPVRKPVFRTTAKPQLISRPIINPIESDENKPLEKSEKPYTSIQRTRRPGFARPSKPSVTVYQQEEELNENEHEIQQFASATRVPTTIRRTTVKPIEVVTTPKVNEATTATEDDNLDEDSTEIPVQSTTTTTSAPITTTEAAKIETTENREEKQEAEINNVDDKKEKVEEDVKPLRRVNIRKPIRTTTEAVEIEDEEQKEKEEKVEINNVADNKEEEDQKVRPSSRPINFRRPRPTATEATTIKIATQDQKNEEQKVEINNVADNKEEVKQNVKPTLRPINFRRTRPTTTETANVQITTEEHKTEINDVADNKEEVKANVKPTLRPINFRRTRPTTTETANVQITTEEHKTEINDVAEDEEEEAIKTTLKPISSRRPRPFQRNINTVKGPISVSVETEEITSTPSSSGRPRPSRAQVSRNIRPKITSKGRNEIDNDENYPNWYKNKNPVPPVLTTEESTEISITEGPVVEIGGMTDRKIPLRFRLKTTEEADEESNTETNVSQHQETYSNEENSESVSDKAFRLSGKLAEKENSNSATKSENESELQSSTKSETSLTEKSESEDISAQDEAVSAGESNETTESLGNAESVSEEKREFIASTESIVSIENETKREEELNSDENIKLNLDLESKSDESSSDNINSNFHSRDIFIPVIVVTEPNETNSTLLPSVSELESESIENANEKLSKREDTQKQIQITDDVFQKLNDESALNLEQQKDEPVFNSAEINDNQQRIISQTIEDGNDSQQKVIDSFDFFDLKDLNKIIEKDSSVNEGHTVSETKESKNLNNDLSFMSAQEKFQSNIAFNNENTQQKIDESSSGSIATSNNFNSEQSIVNHGTSIDGSNQKSQTNQYLNQLSASGSFSENNFQKEINDQGIKDVQHSIGVTDSTLTSSNNGLSFEFQNEMSVGGSSQVDNQNKFIETQQQFMNSNSEPKKDLTPIDSTTENLVKETESSEQKTTHDISTLISVDSNQDQTDEKIYITTESVDVDNKSGLIERQQKLLESDNEQKYILDKSNSKSENFAKEAGYFQQKTTAEFEKKSHEGSTIIENGSSEDSIEAQQRVLNVEGLLKETDSKTENKGKKIESLQQHIATDLNDSIDNVQEKAVGSALNEGSSIQVNHNQGFIEGSQYQSSAELKVLSGVDSTHTQNSKIRNDLTEDSAVEFDNKQESIESQQQLFGADAELRDLQNEIRTQTELRNKETESSQQQIAVNVKSSNLDDSAQIQSGKNEKVLTESSSNQVNNNQGLIKGSQQQTTAELKVLGTDESTHTQTSRTDKGLTEVSSIQVNNNDESIETKQQLLNDENESKGLLYDVSSKNVKEIESSQQQIASDSKVLTSKDSIQTENDKNEKAITEGSFVHVNNYQGLNEQQQNTARGFSQTSETEKVSTGASSVQINNNEENIETQQQLLGAGAELRDLQNEIRTQTEQRNKETESSQQQIATDSEDSTSSDSIQTQNDNNEKLLIHGASVQVNNNQGFVEGFQQQTVTHDLSHTQTGKTEKGLTEGSFVHVNNNQESIETQQRLLGADAELKDLLNEIKTDKNVKETESSQHQIAVDLKDSTSSDSTQTQNDNNEKLLTHGAFVQGNNNQGFIQGFQQQTVTHDLSHTQTGETEKGLTEGSFVHVNNNQESIETQQRLLGADAELKDLLNEIKTDKNVKETESSQHQTAVDLKDSTSSDSTQTQNDNNEKLLTYGAFVQGNNNQRFIQSFQQQTVTHDLSHTQTGENEKGLTEGSFVHVNNNQESIETQQRLLGADAELKDLLNEIKTDKNVKETESSQHQIAVDLKDSTSSDSTQTQNDNNEKLLTHGAFVQGNNNQGFIQGFQQQTVTHDLSHTQTGETEKGLTEGSFVHVNNNQESIETQQRLLGADAELKDLLNEIKTDKNVKETESSQHQIAVDLKDSTSSDSTQTQNDNNEKLLTHGAFVQGNNNQGFIQGFQQQTITHDLSHTQTGENEEGFTEGSFVHLNNNQESIETQQRLLGADAELKNLLKEIAPKTSSESHSTQHQQITLNLNGLAQLNNNHENIETQQKTLTDDVELRQLLLDLETKRQELNTQQLETGDGDIRQLLQEIQTDKTDDFQQRSLRNNKEEGIEPIYFRAPGRYRIVPGELIPVQLYLD